MNNQTKIILGLGMTSIAAYLIFKQKSVPAMIDNTSGNDYESANAQVIKKIQYKPKAKKMISGIDWFIQTGQGAANLLIKDTVLEKPKTWWQKLFG
jgi:hypothetical protein